MTSLNFDSTTVEPYTQEEFSPLPNGEYVAEITESGMKQAKGNGKDYVELVFTITSGEYKGRKVWTRLNLYNENPIAVSIAKGTLSAICRAIGVPKITNTQQLHKFPVVITTANRTSGDKVFCEIKKYERLKMQKLDQTPPAKNANPTHYSDDTPF